MQTCMRKALSITESASKEEWTIGLLKNPSSHIYHYYIILQSGYKAFTFVINRYIEDMCIFIPRMGHAPLFLERRAILGEKSETQLNFSQSEWKQWLLLPIKPDTHSTSKKLSYVEEEQVHSLWTYCKFRDLIAICGSCHYTPKPKMSNA